MNNPKDKTDKIIFSVVIPLYCEQGNVHPLTNRILDVMKTINDNFELILVNDGSNDETWSQIQSETLKDKRVKGLSLSRNFGHQSALLAGLFYSSGDAIISMDGDLQHPPDLIPTLIEKWREGYTVVNTLRQDNEVASPFKRWSSKYFYKLFSIMTDVQISKGSSDFRLLDRNVLNNLLKFNDVDLFLRGAVQWLGFSHATIPYSAAKRHSGSSKYNIWKMLKFARSAIISFSTKPLILGVWIGFITSALAFSEIIYIIIKYIEGETIQGWASTLSILAFLFGILFIILGIIGTYIARIHTSLQNRPNFVIHEFANLAQKSNEKYSHPTE